ncbi:MAG: hypothetical protein QXW62_05710 [Candidatus Methanomethylicaceae archaeon]
MEAKAIATISALPIPDILKDSILIAIMQGKRLFEEINKKHPEILGEK